MFFFFFFLLLLLLFLTSNKPDRHDGRVPSQQGASTTCNLTYWEVSHQTYLQTLLASLVVAKGHNSDLLSGRGRGGGGLGKIGVAKRATFSPSVKRGGSFWQKSMSPILDINCPPTPTIIFIPAKLSFPEHIFFFKIFQPAKIGLKNRYFEEQIHWVSLFFICHAPYTE